MDNRQKATSKRHEAPHLGLDCTACRASCLGLLVGLLGPLFGVGAPGFPVWGSCLTLEAWVPAGGGAPEPQWATIAAVVPSAVRGAWGRAPDPPPCGLRVAKCGTSNSAESRRCRWSVPLECPSLGHAQETCRKNSSELCTTFVVYVRRAQLPAQKSSEILVGKVVGYIRRTHRRIYSSVT